jgi:hypothetical protein
MPPQYPELHAIDQNVGTKPGEHEGRDIAAILYV